MNGIVAILKNGVFKIANIPFISSVIGTYQLTFDSFNIYNLNPPHNDFILDGSSETIDVQEKGVIVVPECTTDAQCGTNERCNDLNECETIPQCGPGSSPCPAGQVCNAIGVCVAE